MTTPTDSYRYMPDGMPFQRIVKPGVVVCFRNDPTQCAQSRLGEEHPPHAHNYVYVSASAGRTSGHYHCDGLTESEAGTPFQHPPFLTDESTDTVVRMSSEEVRRTESLGTWVEVDFDQESRVVAIRVDDPEQVTVDGVRCEAAALRAMSSERDQFLERLTALHAGLRDAVREDFDKALAQVKHPDDRARLQGVVSDLRARAAKRV